MLSNNPSTRECRAPQNRTLSVWFTDVPREQFLTQGQALDIVFFQNEGISEINSRKGRKRKPLIWVIRESERVGQGYVSFGTQHKGENQQIMEAGGKQVRQNKELGWSQGSVQRAALRV